MIIYMSWFTYVLLISIVGGIESFISVILNPDCIFNPLWNLKKKRKDKAYALISLLEI